jgi:ABC-type antimicrobial peptide transport system permease subunit
MIKNYFKIALRNIKRNSIHSFLNISGMAIGMTCTILILLWVHDEWIYDRHFKNADELFRIIVNENSSEGEVSLFAPTPGILIRTLKEQYPEILRSSRYEPHFELRIKKGEEIMQEKAVAAVDKDFLRMFNIEFVDGDINSALNEPHNIILTEEMAHKYFGDDNAFGKVLPVSLGYQVTVTGVIKSLPPNSHIRFDFIVPIEILAELGAPINDWEFLCYNYIELNKGTDSKIVNDKIRDFIKKNKKGTNSEIFLQNIKKIHLYSSRKYTFDIGGHGDITYVRIMSLIAVFILLIACINFMNLSTAQSARRAKEIGVRKVAGANKRKIIVQFIGESLFIVFVAHVIAMIFVELLLPGFNNFTGKQMAVNYQSAGLYIGLIIIILFCGLLAGSYPALYLSSLKPLDIMKGVITRNPGNTQFLRVLVIFQFSLSVMLVTCTLIVGKQLRFMQNKNLGFNIDNIGYFQFPTAPWDPKLKTLKKELSSNPDIINVTKVFYNYKNPLNIEGPSGGFNWSGKKVGDDVLFYNISADEDYAKTFQLELKEGRYFSTEFSTDNNAIVINEQAAKILGFKDPIGEIITTPQGSKLNIIGMVKDFHFKSLHARIEPLIMQLGESNNFFIRMKPENITSTVEFIKITYNSFKPEIPLDFHFLDDDFDTLYRTEKRISKIFGYFSILAIIISCLGLIGLSSFMTERRTKEIGIRKINGAKSNEIFSLLSGEYLIWVMISVIIACPIAWYAMHKWLYNFAYRITISWWVFLLTGFIALLIAFLTVSLQSYRAARKNPIDALRYE